MRCYAPSMPKCATEQHLIHIRGWPVMAARCTTCPFRYEGEQAVANRIRSTLLSRSQICHHPRLHGSPETHLCRGARDEQLTLLHRAGLLPEPTDSCFAQASATAMARSAGK